MMFDIHAGHSSVKCYKPDAIHECKQPQSVHAQQRSMIVYQNLLIYAVNHYDIMCEMLEHDIYLLKITKS